MDTELLDQRFLITGASGGIGRALGEAFAAEGARPVLHFHRNQQAAEELAARLAVPAMVVGADLRDEAETERMFAAVLREGAPLDGIVVNAGVWEARHVPLHEMTLSQWQGTLDADLQSAFLTCRGFLRHLADTPRAAASIVLIASTAGRFGEEGHADYAAAKAAMAHGLTLSLKNEIVRLAPRGRVNCICPGWVATKMAEHALGDPDAVRRATATVAMHKVAQPEEIAHAAVFLSSDRVAGHISGAVLPVDGGMEGRLLHGRPGSA